MPIRLKWPHVGCSAHRPLARDPARRVAGNGAHYQALADRIRLLVLDGRIPIGTRLPAERDLAGRLELSRTTVTAAYRELREAGFVDSVRGSGSVTRLPGPVLCRCRPSGGDGMLDFTKAALPAATSLPAAARAAAEDLPHFLSELRLRPGRPAAPARGDRRAVHAPRAAHRAGPDPRHGRRAAGDRAHRAHVPRSAATAASSRCPPTRTRSRRSGWPGARLVPHHGAPPRRERGAASGRSATGDDEPDGWDADAIEQTFRRANPALAYLIPDFHNPTGASMSPETRERVLAAAAGQGTIVVGDETTADLDIDRVGEYLPMPRYADAAAPGMRRCIMIGSASKSLWGGLRIGWIRADRSLIRN